jgi:hypothetical protein
MRPVPGALAPASRVRRAELALTVKGRAIMLMKENDLIQKVNVAVLRHQGTAMFDAVRNDDEQLANDLR